VRGIKDLWSVFGTHFSFKLKIIKHMQTYSTIEYIIGGLQLLVLASLLLGGLVYLIKDFKKFKNN
jgi:hypothetical protein